MPTTTLPWLGIDIGTTSVALVVVDPRDGRNLFTRTQPHRAGIAPDGPGADLQDAARLLEVVRTSIEQARGRYPRIAALGVTGQMHGIVVLDAAGGAVSPVYTWLDSRMTWRDRQDRSIAERIAAEVGTRVPTGYGAGTTFALGALDQVPARGRSIATVPDYVTLQLTGGAEPVTDASLAHSVGLYSIEAGDFHLDRWRRITTLRPPRVRAAASIVGTTAEGTPVVAPVGDNQASFLAGVRDPERAIAVNIGTSGQISVVEPNAAARARALHRLEARPFPGDGRLLVGATLSGGKSFEVLGSLIGEIAARCGGARIDPYELFGDVPRPTDRNGLSVDTRFAGTRADPSVRGAITGIGLDNFDVRHLYWGIAEGIVAELLELLGDHRAVVDNRDGYLAVSGNAVTHSRALRTVLAERFEVPLRRSTEVEAAARGAAMLAGAAIAGGIEHLPAIRARMVRYRADRDS